MKPLYLDWNLGLGDAIICNGLVRALALRQPDRTIRVAAWPQNVASVMQMFSDIDVQVIATSTENLRGLPTDGHDVLSIGLNNRHWGEAQPFDRAFYHFADVPFDAKWGLFHIPESGTELGPPDYRYALLHEDRSRGFTIDRSRIPGILIHSVTPGKTPRLSDWRRWIEHAADIHCIDSSVMHMAELLPTNGKLFYHRYARTADKSPVEAIFRKDWTVYE